MTNQTKKATIKPFTNTMREKGLTAYHTGVKAESAKEVFFKAIESRVALDQVSQYRPEFAGIAMRCYAQSTGLGDALIEELANPTLKETVKMKGCNLTIRAIKNSISMMTGRWIKAYKSYLTTKVVDGRKAPKKRATKGSAAVASRAGTRQGHAGQRVGGGAGTPRPSAGPVRPPAPAVGAAPGRARGADRAADAAH